MLIVVAIVMWLAERASRFVKPLSQITLGDALTVGVLQAFAVIPGVSRSGITISGGLFRNFTRDAAARFSFLLSTPIIAGAALLKLHHVMKEGLPPGMAAGFVVGMLVSAVVGYATIAWLIRYLQTKTLTVFVVYRIVVGILILLLGYFAGFSG
jgi:undecaprenyl-diphosphatase